MEQVTSSLCAAAESLGKKTNEVVPPVGPSKRTRLSSRKKATEDVVGTGLTPAGTILSTTDEGKEVAKIIEEPRFGFILFLFFVFILKNFVNL